MTRQPASPCEMFFIGFVIPIFFIVKSSAEVYFEDRFLDGNINRWVKSKFKANESGEFEFARPRQKFDEREDGGMKTTQDARFYRYSAAFDKPLMTKDKTICIQYTVKHEQEIDCGGGYVKLMGESFQPENFHGETPYEIMFGPDICSSGNRIVHVIFSYNGKNYQTKKKISCDWDTPTHLYTLIVRPENTFEVLIDLKSVANGSLVDDFDMLPPRTIDDPTATKPFDWEDEAEITNENAEMPHDWDERLKIPDPEVKKPEDWNDKMDGEWVAPTINNPNYRGEWRPGKIPNPDYKGEWKAPQLPNPVFQDDPYLYVRNLAHIGFDLWQVKSGSIFDNIIVSDSLSECRDHAEYWQKRFAFEEELRNKKKDEVDEDVEEDTSDESMPDINDEL